MSKQDANEAQLNVRLTLHPDAVAHPVHRAAKIATEAIPASLKGIEAADFSKPPTVPGVFSFHLTNTAMLESETRQWFRNWLLIRGVQELARGVRDMLEEAYFFTRLISEPSGQSTWGELQDLLTTLRSRANKLNFPDLLSAVNDRLSECLHFEREFLALQAVRNCLEHRAAVVGAQDLDDGESALKLALPRMGIFVRRGDEEVEIAFGSRIEKDEEVVVKSVIRERSFNLGESVHFDEAQLIETAFGCYAFSVDLVSKLPKRP